MKTAQHRGATASGMLRTAVPTTSVVALGCIGGGWLLAGRTGLAGAALGAGLVMAFFTLSLVTFTAARRLDPAVTLLLAIGLYAAKVIALALGLIAVSQAGLIGDPFHQVSLAVTVITCTLSWTVAEIVAATRQRQPLYDLAEGHG